MTKLYQFSKTIFHLGICLLSFATLCSFLSMGKKSKSTKELGTYYVLAPNGLNLRSQADVNSEKLGVIPYASKVEIMEVAASSEMTVDNYPGGMAKVKFGQKVGYVFDGYLCRMPAPQVRKSHGEYNFRDYVKSVRKEGLSIVYEKCDKDHNGFGYGDENGYDINEESLIPYITDWAEAYLLAQRYFDLQFPFPTPSTKEKEVFENPNKPEYIWYDQQTVYRNSEGEIIKIELWVRGEGGGRTIEIVPDDVVPYTDMSLKIVRRYVID